MDIFKLSKYGINSSSITSANKVAEISNAIKNEEKRKLMEKQAQQQLELQKHLENIELQQKGLEFAEKSIKLAEDSNFISKKANTKSNIANWIAFISMIIALIALFK